MTVDALPRPTPSDPPALGGLARFGHSAPARYATAVVTVGVATLGTIALRQWMGPSVSILFFPAVLFTAMIGGYGPSLLATILSTWSLAYFFTEPTFSMSIGPDDGIRLAAFAIVAVVSAYASSARRKAEEAQRTALIELRGAHSTLQKVSGWPVFADVNIAGAASRLLAHAASVAGGTAAVAVWEAHDEPWAYLAASHEKPGAQADAAPRVERYGPAEFEAIVPADLEGTTFASGDPLGESMRVTVSRAGQTSSWSGPVMHDDVRARLSGQGAASAPFDGEHLTGRLFVSGFGPARADFLPLVEVIAHEVGHSLERLYLHDRLQQIAIREDRVRVARDLHDGVLQSLTGIRLRLQGLAVEPQAPSALRDQLLAVERAIAIEQRELRMFIEDLKPAARPAVPAGTISLALEQVRARLAVEWNTPIILRVTPADLSLPARAEQTLRLLVREAIVNALKHAQPTRVGVDVERSGDRGLRLVVSNDGRGFPFTGRLEHEQLLASNSGPVSLRERLVSAGGRLAIESTATGSRIEITLPLES